MLLSRLVAVFEELSATSKRMEKTAIIARFLQECPHEDLDAALLLLQGRVFPYFDRTKLNVAAKTYIKALAQASGHNQDHILALWKDKGDLGLVSEEVLQSKTQSTLFSQELTIEKVYDNLRKLPLQTGTKSIASKISLVSELLTSAKPMEGKYIARITLEIMRVGAGEGVLRDAIVWATFPSLVNQVHDEQKIETPEPTKKPANLDDPATYAHLTATEDEEARKLYNDIVDRVQRAYDVSNDLSRVITTIRTRGLGGLDKITLSVGTPVRVMLAQKAESAVKGFEKVGKPAALEYKYDGFRMQIHIDGDKVTLFTRKLEPVTSQFPDVVDAVRDQVDTQQAILDAEVVGYSTTTNQYQAFQQISQRIRRKYDIHRLVKELPVEVNVFDILWHDGKELLSRPFHERRKTLSSIITPKDRTLVLSRIMITDNDEEANKFYQESLDAGNEGIMMKSLDAPYQPGSRVGFMIKVKPIMETLDLVVVKATWGEGKRSSWLTSFTVACIDDEGSYLEIGKVSTGLKELESEGTSFKEMTALIEPLIVGDQGKDVTIKPDVVIEVAYEEIQKSPGYTSGYALRFPRFIRLRERDPTEVSTVQFVEELYHDQRSRGHDK